MATDPGSPMPAPRTWGTAKVIIVGSVMFTFISYWKTAAVVLCDLASTAFYIGGIVEQAIGPAAPWFILGVMVFSYAVRSVYIESCAMFVRGGVYKVVKEAMGGTLAKISVSALMFDFILTGPISGASAGQYLIGLVLESLQIIDPNLRISDEGTKKLIRNWGSVGIAIAITLYFGYKNLIGIHESSDKAFKIMIATTIMAVVMLVWCGITLAVRGGPVNPIVLAPDLSPKVQYEDATGYKLSASALQALRDKSPDKIPKSDREKLLKEIVDKPFPDEAHFTAEVRKSLGYPQKMTASQKDVLEALLTRAKLVKWYKITDDVLDNLKDDFSKSQDAAPPEAIEKLEAIKSVEFKTAADMQARLTALLGRENRAHFKQILEAAEVTEGFDRITDEQKQMWALGDDRQLKPLMDITGKSPRARKNEITKRPEDPMGFLRGTDLAAAFSDWSKVHWLSVIGLIGLMISFGHSILAMSGEETLAQVYREVQSPKLPNFKKAAFIVFLFSLLFTATISFLAVWLIPDEVRMRDYKDNLLGGLAMYVYGTPALRLLLNAFVVFVGFLILAGAVNTAIIGSNGVLNRVAEDGVLPDWFLKPHPRYGTTYRLLYLIVALQIAVLIFSQGDMGLLGEAYAFGVVWSFVFNALAMVVLRFRDRSPREFKVPFNIRIGKVEVPVGLGLIFLILAATAILNFFTKEVATVTGVIFTALLSVVFFASEKVHEKRLKGKKHEHMEQFNKETAEEITPEGLGLARPYRKLVAIRSPQNLYMLEKALAETDPDTTDVVVMTAKSTPAGDATVEAPELDTYDQQLMTAVVERAEKAGKQVRPLILPTNNPLFAVIRTAHNLKVQELVMGASNKYTADEQLEQIGFYWLSIQEGESRPLTVRILGHDRDVYLDLNGGSRIPKISERKARSVAELRSAGVGVTRVLLAHENSPAGRDLFQAVLTLMDPQVPLTLVVVDQDSQASGNGPSMLLAEKEQASKLGRDILVQILQADAGPEIVRLAQEGHYNLIILGLPPDSSLNLNLPLSGWITHVLRNAHCRVFLAANPAVPQTVAD